MRTPCFYSVFLVPLERYARKLNRAAAGGLGGGAVGAAAGALSHRLSIANKKARKTGLFC